MLYYKLYSPLCPASSSLNFAMPLITISFVTITKIKLWKKFDSKNLFLLFMFRRLSFSMAINWRKFRLYYQASSFISISASSYSSDGKTHQIQKAWLMRQQISATEILRKRFHSIYLISRRKWFGEWKKNQFQWRQRLINRNTFLEEDSLINDVEASTENHKLSTMSCFRRFSWR